MSVIKLRKTFSTLRSLPSINKFLGERALGHTGGYFHYTTLRNLKNMLHSGKLYLSLGRTMNDLREPLKCNPEKWNRLYVISFSYSENESMAMWNIYGNPLKEALRLKFSLANIRNLASGKTLDVFQINNNKCKEKYTLLCSTTKFRFVDIGYLHENNDALRWNQARISKKKYHWLENITSDGEFAGLVKNIAWEYEKETRLLVELPAGMKNYPDKIAIDCKTLWKSVNILCGPCLSNIDLIHDLQDFYNTPDGQVAQRIILDDKHILNSKNLWKVYFKHKCNECLKENHLEKIIRECPLQAKLQ